MRHRVDQSGYDEHLDLQHRHQLWLTRSALQEFAAQQTETNRRTQRTHADQDRDRYRGHALNLRHTCHMFHFNHSLGQSHARTLMTLVVRHRQIHDGQHHENEGLQRDDQIDGRFPSADPTEIARIHQVRGAAIRSANQRPARTARSE